MSFGMISPRSSCMHAVHCRAAGGTSLILAGAMNALLIWATGSIHGRPSRPRSPAYKWQIAE
jgi:hypothetical protein